eukprot:SAG31_NODE_3543_length_4142_cov_11.404622_6_plen_81_part_00
MQIVILAVCADLMSPGSLSVVVGLYPNASAGNPNGITYRYYTGKVRYPFGYGLSCELTSACYLKNARPNILVLNGDCFCI